MTPKSINVGGLDLDMERGNWGRVVALTTGFTVYEPGAKIEHRADHPEEFITGKVMAKRDWESRSLLRWWGRLNRAFCEGTSPSLLDINNATYNPKTHQNTNSDQCRLVPRYDAMGVGFGNWQFAESTPTGAELAIGNTITVGEESSYINLKQLVAIAPARQSVSTTLDDATAITFVVTAGITVTTGALNISEIGMFARLRSHSPNETVTNLARRQLLAYDFFTAVNIPLGGVIAPRYTLSFAA